MSENNRELGPPKADFSAPPPYEQTQHHSTTLFLHSQQHDATPTSPTVNQPIIQQDEQLQEQQYEHGKLPTYEEVQMEKSLNGELPPEYLTAPPLRLPPPPNPLLANLRVGNNSNINVNAQQPALTFIAIDTPETANSNNSLLGTDVMFALAFTIAFIFNWIGFLMLTCFCHTIAARYGALSGFGLSLAKWTLIVKNSTELASNENSWLWWLIMAFGFLICIRAFIQYISIKRTWRLLSTSAQERLLFFY